MDRETLKALLRELGIQGDRYGRYKDSKDNIQMCCPFHGETRPSCGINVYTGTGKCFACETSFNLPKLVAHCMEWETTLKDRDGNHHTIYDYNKANDWLEEKFNVDMKQVDYKGAIMKLEDDEGLLKRRYESDILDLAIYKSGKVAHKYLLDRGFTKETLKKFKVGWDDTRKRVTIPVLWQDGALCGIIGRAVLEMKDSKGRANKQFYNIYKSGNDFKYHIYDGFPIGDILFPLPQVQVVDDLLVIVEGQLDCMWLHQLGFPNVLSSLGSKLVDNQIAILHTLGAKKILLLRDKDEAGEKGIKHDYELLKRDFKVYVTDYPEGIDDPQKLTKEQFEHMLKNKRLYKATKKLRRIN